MRGFVKRWVVSFLILTGVGAGNVYADFSFEPTEIEFQHWPYYCQAMYAHLAVAYENGYWKRIPKKDADEWFLVGDKAGGAWHYCAGITMIDRAKAELNPKKREALLRGGIGSVMWSFDRNRLGPSSPWNALYLTAMARGHIGLKEYETALKLMDELLKHQPGYVDLYLIKSMAYMDMGEYSKAKEALLKGDVVSDGKSSEVKYFLGLVSVELGDIGAAEEYSRQTKLLGYPLSGLDKKIKDARGGEKSGD